MTSAHGFLGRMLKTGVPALVLALLLSTLSIAGYPSILTSAQAATPCAAPVVSKVACENTLPGNPASEWPLTGVGDSTIKGLATAMSVNPAR